MFLIKHAEASFSVLISGHICTAVGFNRVFREDADLIDSDTNKLPAAGFLLIESLFGSEIIF